MKKIFAISFLSVFAVVGVARANYSGYYASGTTDTSKNYNLASVNYVKDSHDSAVDAAEGLVVKSDKETTVAGWSRSSGFAGSDEKAPTIKYMEDSIATAVAGVDTSGLVEKAKVINSQAKNWKDVSVETDAAANPDNYVATWGAVQAKVEAEVDRVEESIDSAVAKKVDIAQGEGNENAIMITNAEGNVIPALVGDCANTTNKCALVTGVDTNGNLALQWEVIARNVVQPTVEE